MDPFKKAARGQGAVELDLSIAAILNALGALAFAIVGAASLAVARGSVRGRIVGAIALVFGTRLVLSNLVILGLPGDPITHGVLDLAQIALVARLCSDLARDLAPARRRLVVLLSIGVALAVAWDVRTFVTADYAAAPTGETLATDSSPTSFLLATSSFIVLAFVCALRALDAENQARTERRAMAFLALAFGIFPSAWLPPLSLDGANAPLMALYVVSFLPWLALTRGSEPALGRLGLLTLVAAALVGTIVTGPVKDALHDTSLSDYGVPGVARMVGVVFLVLAIVRYDLYGVELTLSLRAARPGRSLSPLSSSSRKSRRTSSPLNTRSTASFWAESSRARSSSPRNPSSARSSAARPQRPTSGSTSIATRCADRCAMASSRAKKRCTSHGSRAT